MVTNEQISNVLGTVELGTERHQNLTRLAASTLAGHWHVNDLPWDTMPLLPIPEKLSDRRLKSFVEFGKHAIKVQLAAEHVATTAARALLLQAEKENLDYSVRRAIAAVLNDESSHVAVMTEMDARAEMQYREFPLDFSPSPLFTPFMDAIPTLHPGLTAAFMGAYEAMIAIRGYAEQASYGRPSILGEMAGRAAEDDGRHAKVMRLAAHEWLDRYRALYPDAAERESQIRQAIVDPSGHFWQLLLQHEFYLLHFDPRNHAEWLKRSMGDLALAERILQLLGLTPEELQAADLKGLTEEASQRLAG
ncbi:MAG: hypothetical protein M1482_16635 [Chloroflexi bacterium]|nr:hypothetical protein [Chloroflexota bacterium]